MLEGLKEVLTRTAERLGISSEPGKSEIRDLIGGRNFPCEEGLRGTLTALPGGSHDILCGGIPAVVMPPAEILKVSAFDGQTRSTVLSPEIRDALVRELTDLSRQGQPVTLKDIDRIIGERSSEK